MRDGIGGRVAAVAPGAERGRVPRAVRDRGSLPRGAVRDALARGPHLPGLRPSRLLRAQDPPAVPVQPVQEAGPADRRHRVPGQQAAADRLVPGHLPPGPEQGRDQLDRAGAPARGAAAHGLAHEAQADAGAYRLACASRLPGGTGLTALPSMADREEQKPKLQGRVEIDDAYLGGERSGGKRGRGAAGKTPIVAAVETTAERKPRRLKLTVVKGFRKKEIEKL